MLVCSRKMGAFETIVGTLDSCIQEARLMFERQQSTLSRYPKNSPVQFSHGEKVKETCLLCKREITEYSIVGKWVERESEGGALIVWNCKDGKQVFKGTRTAVVAGLKALSLRAAA